ncbi:MAG TPA: xanthine dehydrogenase family protein molybdopterin-binding subunit [Dissulfurispiraceae bacterium]
MYGAFTRREFLIKSLAGAGFAVAVSFPVLSAGLPEPRGAGGESAGEPFRPSVWIRITPDGAVTITINKSEMGQGVLTSLAMIAAEELEADWEQVRVVTAPAGKDYIDPEWGVQSTGGSSSVRHMERPLRKAGAVAREMLTAAAATVWMVPRHECAAVEGTVRHKKTGRSLSYGQLSEKAARMPLLQNPPLKKKTRTRIVGASMPRLDVPGKVAGAAVFGCDVFIEGMLYAAILRPPGYGAKLVSHNKGAAIKTPGVRSVETLRTGIAVCADTPGAAWKGRTALDARWDKGAHAGLGNVTLENMLVQCLGKPGRTARNNGNTTRALNLAAKRLDATYLLPYLAHATMEPMNCVAHVRRDRCDIWVPTQNQSGVLKAAGKITGLKPEHIHVHTTYLGGGFGRRFETDVAEEALELSEATRKPVKLIWMREEDMQNDFYRPASCCRIEGGIDGKGNATSWSHKIAVQSIFARAMPGMMKNGIDPAAVEGLRNMEYGIPNIRVEYVKINSPVPVGFWRSVGSSHNAFTVECFIDEMAHAARRDPLEFRLQLLKNRPRARRVLELAAEKAGWGTPMDNGTGRGIAQHPSFGSYVAQVAEVSVDADKGSIKVNRVVCAIDCGPVIHPDTVTAQMESGILMGLSAALKERLELAGGGVKSSNFDDYRILRMSETPEIEVHIVRSNEGTGGVGEPGLPPIAPAVANAVFAACGARLRRLPMRPEAVMEAIKTREMR